MFTVEQLIASMLRENTGVALCDSGGAYGRNWERNQKVKSFSEQSSITWEVYSDEVSYTINVYHYLVNQLGLDSLCDVFNSRVQYDNTDNFNGVDQDTEDWLFNYCKRHKLNYRVGYICNTYNGDSSLSQVLQYTTIVIDDTYYVILQIHNGCDVRGGYTTARMFLLESEYTYDDGYLTPENVYGSITTNGRTYLVSNGYNGWSLTVDEVKPHTYEEITLFQEKLPVQYNAEFEQLCSEIQDKPVPINEDSQIILEVSA